MPAIFAGVAVTLGLATPVRAVDRTLGATIPKPSISGAAWTAAQRDSLQHDLDALLVTAPELRGAHTAILAEDTTGVQIYARNADDVTQPASTIKLIVGSAALERLGPMFRFHTSATFRPVSLGSDPSVARRELIVRGGGDPLLRSSDLDALVDAVEKQGTTPLVGVFVDPSHFEPETYGSGWSWDDLPYAYAPPLSSSSLDENVVRLTVKPGPRIGAPALVTSTVLANHIGSCLEGCSASLHFTAEPKAVTGAMGSASTIDTFRSREGATEVVGSIALGADPQTIKVTVPAGPVFLRDVLVQRLAARGITFPSDASTRSEPR